MNCKAIVFADKGASLDLIRLDLLVAIWPCLRFNFVFHLFYADTVTGALQHNAVGIDEVELIARLGEYLLALLHL